jgi:DNA-binding response OmpR family regulator
MRILVVEDDSILAPFLVKALEEASYAVDRAATAAEARRSLAEGVHDLVTLDVVLPDGSGLDLLGEIRASGRPLPVLMLTSRSSVADRVEGLDRGADDYLVKPFALEEFLSRVRVLLRRGRTAGAPVLSLGTVSCDEVAHRVTVADRPVDLTPKEYALLRLLLQSPGVVLGRSRIVNAVWNWSFEGYSNVVDVHVSALRKKLRGSGLRIRSVPRVGYVLEEEPGGDAGEPEAP